MATADDLRLGPYRTTSLLLCGRGIDVYAAIRDDGGPGREVTIARLAAASEADVRAATDAARDAATEDVPHVAPLVEAFERGGVLHVVTRRAPGVRLDALLAVGAGAPLPAGVAVQIVATVAEALHASHQRTPGRAQGVAPWFVRVTGAGEIVVEHLGLPPSLRAGLVSGSPIPAAAMMTPEHARAIEPDASSDVFGLGVLLAHLLTGRAPFQGSEDAILEAILRGDVTPPSFLVGGLAPELDDVIARAVAPEPSERYDSADSFQRALLAAAYPTVGVATASDVRSYLASWEPAATEWEQATPPPVEAGDAPTQLAPPPAVHADGDLEWGDDEETNVWREDDEEVTVVVAREAMESSGGAPSIMDRARSEAQARGRETGPREQVELAAPNTPVAPRPAASPAASRASAPAPERAEAPPQPAAAAPAPRGPSTPMPADDRPPRATPSAESSPVPWMAVVGLLAIAVLALMLRQGCDGAASDGLLEVAVSPLDAEYEVLLDGDVVATGRPPYVIRNVAPGPQQLTVRGDGMQSRTELVNVSADAPVRLNWELEPDATAPEATEATAEAPPEADSTDGEHVVAARARVHVAFDRSREATSSEVERREQEAAEAAEAAAREAAREAAAREAEQAAARAAAARQPQPAAAPAPRPSRAPTPAPTTGRPTPPPPAPVPPAPAPDPEPAAAAEPGFLNVQSVPAARVRINGTDTGRYTPIINLPLEPGRHRIELVNPDFGLERTFTVTIEPGRARTVINRPQ